MECPVCGGKKVQFRSKNNQTLIVKYKCLSCNQIFKAKEDGVIRGFTT